MQQPAATCSTLAAETSPYLGQQTDQASIGKETAWVYESFSCRVSLFDIEPRLLLIDE
jgi:hypothetical protein